MLGSLSVVGWKIETAREGFFLTTTTTTTIIPRRRKRVPGVLLFLWLAFSGSLSVVDSLFFFTGEIYPCLRDVAGRPYGLACLGCRVLCMQSPSHHHPFFAECSVPLLESRKESRIACNVRSLGRVSARIMIATPVLYGLHLRSCTIGSSLVTA
jgi:hypothetical protein